MKTWLIAIIAAGVLIALGGFLIKSYGDAKYNAGAASVKVEASIRIVQIRESREEKKREIRKLNDDDLVRRYCQFVYGGTYDECVRTVRPID